MYPKIIFFFFALIQSAHCQESFGVALKGIHVHYQQQRVVFTRECMPEEAPCTMNHWWSGGTFDGYLTSRVRYYVDNEKNASVNLPLGLAHGMSPNTSDDNGPWSAGALFGRTGTNPNKGGSSSSGSGFFNTYLIPFSSSINVTIELDGPAGQGQYFWLILRGRTKAAAVLTLPGGELLPPTSRLRSYEATAANLTPYAYLPVFNSSSAHGAVLMTTLAVRGSQYEFLEGCLRTTGSANKAPYLLSSGTEDYFLGTFYFNKGPYQMQLAGVTELCPEPHDTSPRPSDSSKGCTPTPGITRFSAYRIHGSTDPLMFENGTGVTWRNGEPGHGGSAAVVNASSFALVYEW
jgi:hypothetical protein